MEEDQIFQSMLAKVQEGYSVMEAGRYLLMLGAEPAKVDAALKRIEALEKESPVGLQAEKELENLELRYDSWLQKRKWRNDRDNLIFKLGNMGDIGRVIRQFIVEPESSVELALSFVLGVGIVTGSLYWIFIFQPSQPRPVNAPPHPMDCTILPSGLPPGDCH